MLVRTVVGDVKIENRIGDALVYRIIRAHKERTPWRCCILIPVLPGFAFPIDHGDASSVRLSCSIQKALLISFPRFVSLWNARTERYVEDPIQSSVD
jgi:phospholipase D1/2